MMIHNDDDDDEDDDDDDDEDDESLKPNTPVQKKVLIWEPRPP